MITHDQGKQKSKRDIIEEMQEAIAEMMITEINDAGGRMTPLYDQLSNVQFFLGRVLKRLGG